MSRAKKKKDQTNQKKSKDCCRFISGINSAEYFHVRTYSQCKRGKAGNLQILY